MNELYAEIYLNIEDAYLHSALSKKLRDHYSFGYDIQQFYLFIKKNIEIDLLGDKVGYKMKILRSEEFNLFFVERYEADQI